MATIFGKTYTKAQLLDQMGSIGTLAGIRQITYQDGFAQSMRAYEVTNGAMRFTVYIDKCLDIGELYYQGMPIHFHARPGLVSHQYWNDGPNAPRSIMCGMMFTCGLGNVGPIQTLENGQQQPQHGFIRNTPAELHGARTYWEGDEFYMEMTGTMREASLFGTNLVLRRTITTKLGETTISIRDEIENESATPDVPLMLMYHCNVGFPMLDANAKLEIDGESMECRDEDAALGAKEQSPLEFGPPILQNPEQVFYHKLRAVDHKCKATMVNPDRHLGVQFVFDQRELPYLIHWKCRDAGNYVTGIEPSNCHPEGLAKEIEGGTLRRLAPHEKINTSLDIKICER